MKKKWVSLYFVNLKKKKKKKKERERVGDNVWVNLG